MNPAQAVGIVSIGIPLGLVIGPPLLGGISAVTGSLKWSFMVDAALLSTIALLGMFLSNESARPVGSVREDDNLDSPLLPAKETA